MKILQINAVYKKSSTGRNVQEMHEYLVENEIESYIAAPDLCELEKNLYKIGNWYDMKVHGLFSRLFGLQGYFSCISTTKLLLYIKKVNPEIIHLHNLHGNYINLKMLLKYIARKNIATVVTLHDCWFYTGRCCHYIEDNCYKWKKQCNHCPALKKYNKSWFFDRSKKMQRDKINWFSRIDKLGVIGVSSWVTEDAKTSPILKNAKKHKTIYNWVDLELFKPIDNAKKNLGLDDRFVILGVSQTWIERKGVGVFEKLSRILPDDCVIVLVGDANGHESTDKIKFVGATDSVEELAQYYAAADVFINPSIQETFGKTTAEALACGTPVIGFNATATPELVGTDEKCGYIIDINDAEAYLEKIELIKNNGKSLYTSECRKRAETMFDKDANLKQYLDFYKELMA